MKPIFISYRRDDGIDTAQLLQMHLINMFGEESVFLDTNTMKAGEEFPVELHNAVTNSKVVIVMIGKNWKGSDPLTNRLKQGNDWVRKELEIAVTDDKRKIFPVLVKGATTISSFKDLPASIERLTKFNCAELREKEFKQDLLQFIPLIEPSLQLEDPLKDLPLDEDRYMYPPGSPYKGLDYFTEKDAKLFFGRGAEIRKLYYKIRNGTILFLYGQSGSGKSSLLFAGLKPRMEKQGWHIKYFRRELGINLSETLNNYMLGVSDNSKQLVILDQVEEIFTNPDDNISSDAEAQQLLSSVRNASEKIRVLLGFRKEFLAEIKKLFAGLVVEEIYLEPLLTKGVLEAIRGIAQSDEARDNYELKFSDDEVPMAIAQSLLSDEESHVAPLLQVILRKMWDKVEHKKPRIFSKELLEEVKSNNLFTFLNDQISAVKVKFEDAVESGLVLDILYFFTTSRGTSASHSKDAVVNNYNSTGILKVINELKNKYLLSEPKQENADANVIRLAHDSLAALIRELYGQSNLPGQRASRLLESKRLDIEAGYEVEFSKSDLLVIDIGKESMRSITKSELKVIEQSRKQIQKYELELEEKNTQLQIALKEAKEQTLQAKAKTLSAAAREKFSTDPTLALRLAEAACKTTSKATKEAQSALVDIMRKKGIYYKENFKGHTENLNSVAFSPKGKYILTGSSDNTARLWNLDGTPKQTFEGHTGSVFSVAFSPDGKFILTGSTDKTARLWNLEGTPKQTFEGHTENLNSVAFSPKGKYILTGSSDNTARLWNLDGTPKQTFEGHTGSVFSVAFSPHGKCILTGSNDKTAKLWNLDGTLKQSFEGHSGIVNSVAFSANGKYILTGSSDNTAKLWNLDGTLKQSFKGHSGNVNSVAFSPHGKYILTGSFDQTAKLWNLAGTLKQSFEGHSGNVNSVAFSPDGKYILTGRGDNTAKLWNLNETTNQSFEGHSGWVNSVAFSPNGKCILTGSNDKTAKLWNLDGTMKQSFEGHSANVNSVAFSPDGKYIFTGSSDNTARLWNLDGTLKQLFAGHSAHVTSGVFSPDGRCILTGSNDKTAKLWNLDGTLKQSFEGHACDVSSVAFSPDGKNIITGSRESRTESAKLWNLDGSLKQSFPGNLDYSNSIALSPDGKIKRGGSRDEAAKIWDLDVAQIIFIEGPASGVNSVAFSPDGKYILTGSSHQTAMLWNLDGTLKQSFEGYSDGVNSVAFSLNGEYIIIGSEDKTSKLLSLDGTLKQSCEEGHTRIVTSVAFSPDGNCILTGSHDQTAQLWRPFWQILDPQNTYVPSSEQLVEYDIPKHLEWGKEW